MRHCVAAHRSLLRPPHLSLCAKGGRLASTVVARLVLPSSAAVRLASSQEARSRARLQPSSSCRSGA
jgi:hypothetical protein